MSIDSPCSHAFPVQRGKMFGELDESPSVQTAHGPFPHIYLTINSWSIPPARSARESGRLRAGKLPDGFFVVGRFRRPGDVGVLVDFVQST